MFINTHWLHAGPQDNLPDHRLLQCHQGGEQADCRASQLPHRHRSYHRPRTQAQGVQPPVCSLRVCHEQAGADDRHQRHGGTSVSLSLARAAFGSGFICQSWSNKPVEAPFLFDVLVVFCVTEFICTLCYCTLYVTLSVSVTHVFFFCVWGVGGCDVIQ